MTKMKKKTKKDSAGKGIGHARKEINKRYGKGALIRLGDSPLNQGPCLSTSSFSLDIALGGRGLPFGRIVEIYGPESSGKTTLALHLIANYQKEGVAALIDAEHALDPKYAKNLGVDLDNLLLSQPDYGEQALGITKKLIKSGDVKLIVIDSVAALVPKKELDGEMEDITVALQARMMSSALRQISGLASRSGVLVIFINQQRSKIGMGFSMGGITTPGGMALKFWASVRIEIKRRQTKKEHGKSVANWTFAKVVKSKICPPFSTAEFFITFGIGIDRKKELFHWAKKGRIIKTKKGMNKFNEVLGKGERKFMRNLAESKKDKKELIEKTLEFIKKTI